MTAADRALFTELAAIFARAALRLTQLRENLGTSAPRERQISLDLRRTESVTVTDQGGRHG